MEDRFGSRILKAGADEKTKLAAYREVSPVNYLCPGSPPLLMMQGDKDQTIRVQHAHYIKERGELGHRQQGEAFQLKRLYSPSDSRLASIL